MTGQCQHDIPGRYLTYLPCTYFRYLQYLPVGKNLSRGGDQYMEGDEFDDDHALLPCCSSRLPREYLTRSSLRIRMENASIHVYNNECDIVEETSLTVHSQSIYTS